MGHVAWALGVAIAASVAAPALAEDVAACRAVKGNALRHACHRRITRLDREAAASRPLRMESAWRIHFATSVRDGSPEVYAENAASTPATNETDWNAVKELLAYCRDHRLGFAIKTDGNWGYPFWGPAFSVTYGTNGGPTATESWPGTLALDGVLSPQDAVVFMRTLPDEGSMFFRVTDAHGQDHEATFRLHGVARARELIAKTCERT
jgi:hypothetical protein